MLNEPLSYSEPLGAKPQVFIMPLSLSLYPINLKLIFGPASVLEVSPAYALCAAMRMRPQTPPPLPP